MVLILKNIIDPMKIRGFLRFSEGERIKVSSLESWQENNIFRE